MTVETWDEYIERQRSDPQERAKIEEYLAQFGDSQPEQAAYWEAILRGDKDSARIIMIRRDIVRLQKKVQSEPFFADILQSRIAEVEALENAARAARG